MLNDGEVDSWFIGGVICGFTMLSLDQIASTWQELQEHSAEGHTELDNFWTQVITPEGAIQPQEYHPAWIPLFTDSNGNYIGLDIAPGEAGQVGQLINFGLDEYDRIVIANSTTEFIAFINEQFANGNAEQAIFQGEDGTALMFGLTLESHLTDDIRNMRYGDEAQEK